MSVLSNPNVAVPTKMHDNNTSDRCLVG